MKCYEYCQALFDEVFMPVLQAHFPYVLPRLSDGVVGWGSDVLGGDDELSKDHNWGHGRCQLMLPEQDVKEYGAAISAALLAAVPETFRGVSTAQLEPNEIAVSQIETTKVQELSGSINRTWMCGNEHGVAITHVQ